LTPPGPDLSGRVPVQALVQRPGLWGATVPGSLLGERMVLAMMDEEGLLREGYTVIEYMEAALAHLLHSFALSRATR